MRVNIGPAINGQQLGYDTEDVENFSFSTPRDVHKLPNDPETGQVRRELGTAHLHVHVTFKHGCKPTWADVVE